MRLFPTEPDIFTTKVTTDLAPSKALGDARQSSGAKTKIRSIFSSALSDMRASMEAIVSESSVISTSWSAA